MDWSQIGHMSDAKRRFATRAGKLGPGSPTRVPGVANPATTIMPNPIQPPENEPSCQPLSALSNITGIPATPMHTELSSKMRTKRQTANGA